MARHTSRCTRLFRLILPVVLLAATAAQAQSFDRLVASDAKPGDLLGSFDGVLAVSGNRILVGKPFDDDACPPGPDKPFCNSGAAYVFERHDGVWMQVAKLTAARPTGRDWFGAAVALDGERALVGAPFQDDAGTDAGTVYVFERIGGQWQEVDRLFASDSDLSDLFGDRRVILRGDLALIAAPQDSEANLLAGAIYVFEFNGLNWIEIDKLTASDAGVADFLGHAMDLDGDRLIAGAPTAEKDNISIAGEAYIFERNRGVWQEWAKFQPADLDTTDVLANDTDPDADALSLSITTPPNHGAAAVNNGTLTYTPNPGFGGQDAFSYRIDDGDGGSDQASVAVSVGAPPSAPQITSPTDGARVVVTGDPATPFVVEWTAATDPDGDPLGYTWQLAATSDFATVLFSSETGAATRFETTFGVVGAFLRDNGVGLGMSVTFFHRALASDGGFTTPGASVRLTLERGSITAREDEAEVPARYELWQNYPNPFNPRTTIRFGLPEASVVRLAVFDVLGREVAVLAEGWLPAGRHEAAFEVKDLPSGVYVYRLDAGRQTLARRMLLLR